MRVILPSDCNARLRTRRVDCKEVVRLSQPLCTYYNKGSHMLSIVDTWGRMQYFFKTCFAIVTTGFCLVSLTRMHWHPVPQEINQSYTRVTMHWYTTSNRQGNLFPMRFFAKLLYDGLFHALDDVYIHHQQCQQSIFPFRNRFYARLITINNIETSTDLAMINSAAVPPWLTVKPSYNTSASTKYQAWLPCCLMIKWSIIEHKHTWVEVPSPKIGMHIGWV